MLETSTLNQLIFDAFSGKTTWFEASTRYPLDEFINAFYRTRAAMQKNLADLSDAQVAYVTTNNPIWSLSETVTHLIYTQNFYYNQLLDNATHQLPHMVEAARGFGEGSKPDIQAAALRAMLDEATIRIKEAIEQTRSTYQPERIVDSPFGKANYITWLLLLCAHEVDHVQQAIIMRRLSRHFVDKNVTLPDKPLPAEPD